MPIHNAPDGPAIEADGLAKRYGDVTALASLSLRAPYGSVFALLGPNGAGKSTAVRILTTLSRADAGWGGVAGHDGVRDAAAVGAAVGGVCQGFGGAMAGAGGG